MLYLILAITLTIIHYRNVQADKREEEMYQAYIHEQFEYTQRRRDAWFEYRKLESVNQYAHQKNYIHDVMHYNDTSGKGKGNQGLAKEVIKPIYNQVRKKDREVVAPDEPYTGEQRRYAKMTEREFERSICEDMAQSGFFKESVQRWSLYLSTAKSVKIRKKTTQYHSEWDIRPLADLELQTSSA